MAAFQEPILHVDMDAFYVEVERLRDAGLRGRPVAVGGAGVRGVIASASYEARAFGVRSAMPTTRALRLCPQLVVVPADHGEYGRVSERVFAIFRDTTPLVEGLSVDEAFLVVSGLRLHHASAVAVGRSLRERIRSQLGLPASVGVAATKFVAKLASEDAKPDGILHMPVEAQVDYLHRLPVERLWGVGEATRAALARLGVRTVGELAATDRRSLERAVGSSLARHLLGLAAGEDPRPVVPDRAAKSVSVEHTYERDLNTEDEVVAALRVHVDRVAWRLRRSGMEGRTVTVKVRFSDFTTVTRSETFPSPTSGHRDLFAAARRLLERIDRAGQGVRLLGVGIEALSSRAEPAQMDILEDDRWRRVDSTVDAIRDRFGPSSVAPGRAESPLAERDSGPDEQITETDANVY